jgi:RNA polymerase sigma-70 factor, ECF subfamily
MSTVTRLQSARSIAAATSSLNSSALFNAHSILTISISRAAICPAAAVHAEAEPPAATDWRQIVALYDRLERIQPSPVVQLNRVMAIAMCEGREAGLAHIDAVLEHGELANYYLAHSARADMYRRLGMTAEARSFYEKALALSQQEPERQFLQEMIRRLK